MNLSSFRSVKGSRNPAKRVGCGQGSGHGKTCGRGHKGQYARSGHKHKAGFEGGQMRLISRLPKRGFHNCNRISYLPVNIDALASFVDWAVVDIVAMLGAGIIGSAGARVKILGDGEVKQKLTVRVHAFSASARSKIEAAGGVCELVSLSGKPVESNVEPVSE